MIIIFLTFLVNPNNKQLFINKLSNILKKNRFATLRAADADWLIVGEVMDLLVLFFNFNF